MIIKGYGPRNFSQWIRETTLENLDEDATPTDFLNAAEAFKYAKLVDKMANGGLEFQSLDEIKKMDSFLTEWTEGASSFHFTDYGGDFDYEFP